MVGEAGSFERKQLLSPSRIVRWSHGRRFEVGRQFVSRLGGKNLLDYGCGDGTFLLRVHDLVEECVGVDFESERLGSRVSHLAGATSLCFDDIKRGHDGKYDLVFCMEVLEHCTQTDVEKVLVDLERLVSPSGAIVISVPIETGPTLVGKYTMRRYLGRKDIGDYKWTEPYSLGHFFKMVFAGQHSSIHRPVYSSGGGEGHSHFGFNWRALRARLQKSLTIDESTFTPLAWTRGWASSQAWFVCRKRASTASRLASGASSG